MKGTNVKQKFIELRAGGLSFDNISEQIDVSKPTLIKWEQELNKEIKQLEFIHHENVVEQYKLSRRQRIEFLLSQIRKIYDELGKRDFSKDSTKDLVNIASGLEGKAKALLKGSVFHTGHFEKVMESVSLFDDLMTSDKVEKDVEVVRKLDF